MSTAIEVHDGAVALGGRPILRDIDLTVSRASKDVVAAKVNNVAVDRGVAKAPDLTELVTRYQTLVAPLANRVVGSITADITSANNAAGESAAGGTENFRRANCFYDSAVARVP